MCRGALVKANNAYSWKQVWYAGERKLTGGKLSPIREQESRISTGTRARVSGFDRPTGLVELYAKPRLCNHSLYMPGVRRNRCTVSTGRPVVLLLVINLKHHLLALDGAKDSNIGIEFFNSEGIDCRERLMWRGSAQFNANRRGKTVLKHSRDKKCLPRHERTVAGRRKNNLLL